MQKKNTFEHHDLIKPEEAFDFDEKKQLLDRIDYLLKEPLNLINQM